MGQYHMFLDERVNIVKIALFPKPRYRFNAIHNTLPMVFFTELKQANKKY